MAAGVDAERSVRLEPDHQSAKAVNLQLIMRVVFAVADGRYGLIEEERLTVTTERHLIALSPPPLKAGDPIAALRDDASVGLVVALAAGCPGRSEIDLLSSGLAANRRTWLHWPEEGAVEVATVERLESYRRQRLAIILYQKLVAPLIHIIKGPMRASLDLHGMPSSEMPAWFLRRIRAWVRLLPQRPPVDASAGIAATPDVSELPMVRHARRLA